MNTPKFQTWSTISKWIAAAGFSVLLSCAPSSSSQVEGKDLIKHAKLSLSSWGQIAKELSPSDLDGISSMQQLYLLLNPDDAGLVNFRNEGSSFFFVDNLSQKYDYMVFPNPRSVVPNLAIFIATPCALRADENSSFEWCRVVLYRSLKVEVISQEDFDRAIVNQM
ncbi:MAG: hypothetical protein AB7Q64_23870 [Verrucomicrobiales bacterium]